MSKPDKSQPQDYQDFRFRLRHDQILKQRLRRAQQEAVITMAGELGFNLTLADVEALEAGQGEQQAKKANTSNPEAQETTTAKG
jgi:hypothetical protein